MQLCVTLGKNCYCVLPLTIFMLLCVTLGNIYVIVCYPWQELCYCVLPLARIVLLCVTLGKNYVIVCYPWQELCYCVLPLARIMLLCVAVGKNYVIVCYRWQYLLSQRQYISFMMVRSRQIICTQKYHTPANLGFCQESSACSSFKQNRIQWKIILFQRTKTAISAMFSDMKLASPTLDKKVREAHTTPDNSPEAI